MLLHPDAETLLESIDIARHQDPYAYRLESYGVYVAKVSMVCTMPRGYGVHIA